MHDAKVRDSLINLALDRQIYYINIAGDQQMDKLLSEPINIYNWVEVHSI